MTGAFRCIPHGNIGLKLIFLEVPSFVNFVHCLGPVCVVAIAGPYRTGKSYILRKAFDQPPVFPLGHEMLSETMGVWMWILPDKHEVRET